MAGHGACTQSAIECLATRAAPLCTAAGPSFRAGPAVPIVCADIVVGWRERRVADSGSSSSTDGDAAEMQLDEA